MKKRIISLFLVIVMLVTMLPIYTVSSFAVTSGDFEYVVLADGTVEITDYIGIESELEIPLKIDGYVVTSIGNRAFYDDDVLTVVLIPSNVKSIGLSAFDNCSFLTKVILEEGLRTIDAWAFYNCDSLTSITIPASVSNIDIMSFSSCDSLTEIIVNENNETYSNDSCGALFDKDKTVMIQYPIGNSRTSYVILDSVTTITSEVFRKCSYLTSVTIPDSVTKIDETTFLDCGSLKYVFYTGTEEQWNSIDRNSCDTVTDESQCIIHYNSIGHTGGDWIIETEPTCISNGLKHKKCEICNDVFDNKSIDALGHNYVDNFCTRCNEPQITNTWFQDPNGWYYIGEDGYVSTNQWVVDDIGWCFVGDDGYVLKDAWVEDVNGWSYVDESGHLVTNQWLEDELGLRYVNSNGYMATNCWGEDGVGIYYFGYDGYLIKNKWFLVNDNIWCYSDEEGYCTKQFKFIIVGKIELTVKIIEYSGTVTDLAIPATINGYTVTKIESAAFDECTELINVVIPNSITSIDEKSFYKCGSLKSIFIPKAVTSIGYAAFDECFELTEIYYSGSKSQWGLIVVGGANDYLLNGTFHYNSSSHIESDWKIEKDPTCTTDGLKYKECSICGQLLKTETIKKYGHNWSDWEVVKESSCKETGLKLKICLICLLEEYDIIEKIKHTQGNWIIDIEPTCMTKGKQHTECEICGEMEYDTIPALGHNYENGTCINCGEAEFTLVGWVQDAGGWRYYNTDGTLATNKWLKDSVGWCYVGDNGYCVTNTWKKDSKGWCYLDANGRMATNKWIKDSQGWCYVGANGYCVTNTWKKDSKGWCYLDENGSMTKNEWIKDGGKWYYLDGNGYMVTGTKVIGGKTYKFNSSGIWVS